MSVIIPLISGFILGFLCVAKHDDVVLVEFNVDGTKWITHAGKKYNLVETEGGGK